MNQAKSISILHVVLISMTFIGLKNHVTIIPAILQEVGRDGWMSVILGMLLILPWLLIIIFVHKKSKQQRLADWLQAQFGRIVGRIITYTLAIYLLISAAFTMRETLLWITTAFLPKTPMIVLLIIYTILIISLVSTNLETIAIVNVFVLFGVVTFGFFVAFVNIQVKDYSLLQPFLEFGFMPVINGAIFPASGFVELLLFLFIQHGVKGRINFYHLAIMLFLLMGLTLGPLIGAITEFGPIEAAKQRYPAYEEWGLATIGRFIEHMDFFSAYQWLTGAFIRIGIFLYIVADLFNIKDQKREIWKMVAPPLFFISLLLGMIGDNAFLDFHEYDFLIITFFFFFALSLILLLAALLPQKDVKNKHDS